MARARSLADLPQGVGLALAGRTTRDDLASAVLVELLHTPPVVRAGVALSELGGRQLRFCTSDFLHGSRDLVRDSRDLLQGSRDVLRESLNLRQTASELVDGARPDDGRASGAVPWCEIDGMADVPLVRAVLSGSPVLLGDLTALGDRYPHLVERQASLGTRALAALPLTASDGQRVGGLLITLGRALDLTACEPVLGEAAGLVADAFASARQPGTAASGGHGDLSSGAPAKGNDLVLQLPADARAPRQAREFLRSALSRWCVDTRTAEDAELCLSEVVTNAVIHASSAMEMSVRLDGDRLRVAVRDGGASGPRRRDRSAHPHDGRVAPATSRRGAVEERPETKNGSSRALVEAPPVGGRGLLLVEHLADRWTYEATTQGTTASFEMVLR